MRRLDNQLHYERHYIADVTQPVIITSIITNNVGIVRSHFERVRTRSDVLPQRDNFEAVGADEVSKRENVVER